jgi:hypothetical protein
MPLGKPEDRLTEARDRGRERDDKKPIGDEHGGHPPDVWMEQDALEENAAACVQASQAHLPSLTQGRMPHATLLRSRMNGNVHVRLCRRVEVVTPRLRQRADRHPQPAQENMART